MLQEHSVESSTIPADCCWNAMVLVYWSSTVCSSLRIGSIWSSFLGLCAAPMGHRGVKSSFPVRLLLFSGVYHWHRIRFAPFSKVISRHKNILIVPSWHRKWSNKIRGYSFTQMPPLYLYNLPPNRVCGPLVAPHCQVQNIIIYWLGK